MKRIYTYEACIIARGYVERLQSHSIPVLHQKLKKSLSEMYLNLDNTDQFIRLRTFQWHLKKLSVNDFTLYKYEDAILQVFKKYKPNYDPIKKEQIKKDAYKKRLP